MRAADGFPGGEAIDVMSIPLVTDDEIGRTRGRLIVQLRLKGWSYTAIGKLFRCTDRWVRAELRDFPASEKRKIAEELRHARDEGSQFSMAI